MMLRWIWLSAVVLVLDQITKHLVTAKLTLYEVVPVLPVFNITLTHNRGAAFSFLHDAGGWQRWFFTVLAIAVSIFILAWMRRASRDENWLVAALALVLGGAIGNVIDRIRFGYVVDFIQVHWKDQWYYPTFNVADSAITVGAVMLLWDAFARRRSKTDEQRE